MSDWLTEELRYQEKMDGFEALRLTNLTIKSVDEFYDVANPRDIRSLRFDRTHDIQIGETISVLHRFWNIESISFGLEFKEPLNHKFLNKLIEALPNLRELSFNCGPKVLSWEILSKVNLSHNKKLYVRMCEDQTP